MSSSNLIRWSGLAAIGSGVLFVIVYLIDLTIFGPGPFSEIASLGFFIFEQALYLIGAMLLLVGLVGLYARQSEVAGLLGLVGFLVAFVGTVLMAGFAWAGAFIVPVLESEAPEILNSADFPPGDFLRFITLTVGWLLFGISSLRSRVYPLAASILFMVGALFLIGAAFPGILFGVTVAWLGFVLFSGRDISAEQASEET